MYINDVHILAYIIIFAVGAIIGQSIGWLNKRIIDNKKIFSKDILNELKNKLKINYFTVFTTAILYIIVLFKFGIKDGILNNLELIKYIFLIPILLSIIIIDYKKRIIPNRLTLTILESGIIFAFLYGINNLFIARDYLLAALIGASIFAIIAIIGRIFLGKEAMGMGDIKLMAVLGLYFGIPLIISISIISFVIAGIYSATIILIKKKKGQKCKLDEYISFGPCIGLSAILCIIIPEQAIISVLLTIFTLGRYKG